MRTVWPKMTLWLVVLILGTPTWAQVPELSVSGDPRLRTITYDGNRVVPLKVATNFQLTILFGPDERVENVALGDSGAWQATLNGRGDALFIKPVRSSGTTNMTVITDLRVYIFELSPSFGPAPDAPFTLRFSYPDTASQSTGTVSPHTSRYRLSGYRDLRPQEVSDDGTRTYVRWHPERSLPAIFAIDDRGQESLLSGQMRDGLYVIDAVHPALLFRLDRRTARASRVSNARAR